MVSWRDEGKCRKCVLGAAGSHLARDWRQRRDTIELRENLSVHGDGLQALQVLSPIFSKDFLAISRTKYRCCAETTPSWARGDEISAYLEFGVFDISDK